MSGATLLALLRMIISRVGEPSASMEENQLRTTLKDMPVNRDASVIGVRGGKGCNNKLSAMGLHPGREIRKIGGSFIGGPITVQINGSLVAVGEGMAERIIVELKPVTTSER